MKKKNYIDINVTKTDIQKGIPQDGGHCPIARAIKRKRPSYSEIDVAKSSIYAGNEKEYVSEATPFRAKEFITNFDIGGKVRPFKFRLNLYKSSRK